MPRKITTNKEPRRRGKLYDEVRQAELNFWNKKGRSRKAGVEGFRNSNNGLFGRREVEMQDED